MNYIQKLSTALMLGATLVLPFAPAAAAVTKPSATGQAVINAGGFERDISFDVTQNQTSNCTTTWNVTGNYTITVNATGSLYSHDVSITNQTGNSFNGTAHYPSGATPTINETVNGTVNGTNVAYHFTYDGTSYFYNATGAINTADGSISGTWTDNTGQFGTWSMPSGSAHMQSISCNGKGDFEYADVHNDAYVAKITCVNIVGNTAIFSGPVTKSTNNTWLHNYVIVKAVDIAKHGSGKDQISASFVPNIDPQCSTAGLVDGPFTVNPGEITVK